MAIAINEPANYERFKIKHNGSFVNTIPRFINIGNGLIVTENTLEDRLDIAVSTVLGDNVIANTMLQDNSVTNPKLADNAVNTAEIVDNAVTTSKILDGNITTAKILDGNVTTTKILDGNVTTTKILDGNVTTTKILDDNVTSAKIGDLTAALVLNNIIPLQGKSTGGTPLNLIQMDSGNAVSVGHSSTVTSVKLLPGVASTVEALADGSLTFGSINKRIKMVDTGLTAQRTYTFPNASGQVAVLADIPGATDLSPYQAFKSIELTGMVQGNNTSVATMGEGLLAPPVLEDTPTAVLDNNGGAHLSFQTGTTEETLVGWKSNRAIAVREVNPEFFCKIATPSITAMKMFVGFSELATQDNIDPTALPNADGFGFCINTSASTTNYRIYRNAGDASASSGNVTTTIKTTPISIWMKLYDTLAKIDYAVWTTSNGDPSLAAPTETGSITTDIPAVNVDMYYHCLVNNFTTTNKTLDHWISKVRTTGEFV